MKIELLFLLAAICILCWCWFLYRRYSSSLKRFMLATDSSQIGVWEFDFKTQKILSNDQFDFYFGFKKNKNHWYIEELLGLIHPDDRQSVENEIKQINGQENIKIEFRVINTNGDCRWLTLIGKIIDSKMYGTIRDVSDIKRSEEALREALFYRDEFMSIASHELKTPLTSLKLQSQLFIRAISRNDPEAYSAVRVDRLVSETDKLVNRLVSLVDDMLDISRIRTGRLSITCEKVVIGDLVRDIVKRHQDQFSRHGRIPPEITKCENLELSCDRHRIEQVINNILSNTFHYGKGNPVFVEVKALDKSIAIHIEDHGMGIEVSNLESIFNRFQRAIPASEVSGLGLGLYIAKQIVSAHGGDIKVTSELHKGSTFTVELPIS